MSKTIPADISEQLSHISNDPPYVLNIGDRINVGRLHDCYVVDKNEDSTAYLIKSSKNPDHPRWCIWHDVRPYQKNENHDIIKNGDIRLEFTSTDLFGILVQIESYGINMDPTYQRDYVWALEDKQKLIQSIFENVDIGKIVFRETMNEYEIVDGKQRLSAIIEYYENRFPYNGLYFNDLSTDEMYHFKKYLIQVATLRDNVSDEDVIRTFLLLNTSGKTMDQEHIDKVKEQLADMQKG